jgi:arabinogalactan endo-1,4-beta-galactosidase
LSWPLMRNRIEILVAAALVGVLMLMHPASASPLHPPAKAHLPAFLAGADVSLLTKEEQLGTLYKDSGKPRDALAIFKAHGVNCLRLRLWVHPTGQDIFVNDLPYTVALGRRIKRAGFVLMLDIHYSDTWADPGHQEKPAAWSKLPFAQLVQTTHDYTKTVIEAMRTGGAMPDIVAVGNEITGGMLWPDGKDYGDGHDFTQLGKLLKAGIQGVYDGVGDAPRPWIMIHIDRGGDWNGTKWFFDGIIAQGVPFDMIGESYYPFFQGSLAQLQETLTNAAERYHKPIVVAETGYPYEPSPRAADAPLGSMGYPLTPEGQRQFLAALVVTVRATPNGLSDGVIYWEPEWIPVQGLQGSWDTTTLFDDQGNALPGLSALAPLLAKSPSKTPSK